MPLKNPGGNLAWLTPLMILGGLYLGYQEVQNGRTGLAFFYSTLAACAALVWFDLKAVAFPLWIYCGLAVLAGVAVFVKNGFSGRLAFRVALIGFFAYDVYVWYKRPPEVEDSARDPAAGLVTKD
jgi:hypothetical protein